jgi:hypothetical protein
MSDLRWLEDHVPNYLWAGGQLVGDIDAGLLRLARILDLVEEARGAAGEPDHVPVDGGLVAFEAIPLEVRPTVLQHLREAGIATDIVSTEFAHALLAYPEAPGSWLLELVPVPDEADLTIAEQFLSRSIRTIAGGNLAGGTALKATAVRQNLRSGRIKIARDSGWPLDELSRYPDRVTSDERAMIESVIRASFGSFQGMADDAADARVQWAKTFWNSNWSLYSCKVRADEDGDPPVVDSEPERHARGKEDDSEVRPVPDGEPERDARDEADDNELASEAEGSDEPDALGRQVFEVWSEFIATVRDSDPHLYDPSRHEVLTGLASHALRLTLVVAGHPGLWVGEFSAPLLRVVAEVIIDLAWLATPEGRMAGVPLRFKEFGRGRLKLAKLHAEEFARQHKSNPLLDEVLEALDDEVNREIVEEFQDISLEATFTGRDLRKMAMASDAEWPYKLQLAPMSAVVHSEWPMLTRYAMELCVNPVHRLHWLPRRNLEPAVRPVAGRTAVVMAREVFDAYRRALDEPASDTQNQGGPT